MNTTSLSINDLSKDILSTIFSFLDIKKNYSSLARVNKLWNVVLAENIQNIHFNNIRNLYGSYNFIWEKADQCFGCVFYSKDLYVLINEVSNNLLVVSSSNNYDETYKDYHFHKSYKDFLILSFELNLIVLNINTGVKVYEYDMSKYYNIEGNELLVMSPIDQNGCCHIVDQNYHLFFIKIDKTNGEISEFSDRIDLSKFANLPDENANDIYYKNNCLIIDFGANNQLQRGYIFKFENNQLVNYKRTPTDLNFYALSSDQLFAVPSNSTLNLLEFYEYENGTWIQKWSKLAGIPNYTLYNDIIVSMLTSHNIFKISSFDQFGNTKHLILDEYTMPITTTYHDDRLYLFFKYRFYIYNLIDGQLECNLNGYPFKCNAKIKLSQPIVQNDQFIFSFQEGRNPTCKRSGIIGFKALSFKH